MRRLQSREDLGEVLRSRGEAIERARPGARRIIEEVQRDGDSALRRLTRQLDGAMGSPAVPRARIEEALAALDPGDRRALERALGNIRRFHAASLRPAPPPVRIEPGLVCRTVLRPLQSVGLYVPGGSAPLVSTLLMLAIPAQLAGVERIALCSPPGPQGRPAPLLLAACGLLGLEEVYALGGAQAIAALAFGTASIARVEKIVGPGNRWVTAAKAELAADPRAPAIDFLAGPSELVIVADESARASLLAADLLSQAEHDPQALVGLITTCSRHLEEVPGEVRRQLGNLPRQGVAQAALRDGFLLRLPCLEAAIEAANQVAPEHLSLQVRDPERWVDRVRSAGALFLGPFTPEALGDYCAGPNHVLPTGGGARTRGGVGLATFQKSMSVERSTPEALASLAETACRLARLEGLEGHARAVEARLEKSS